jgi:hypothetical protein
MANLAEHRLSALRCALTGAAVLGIQFVVCWAAAVAGLAGSHMYIANFTLAPVGSPTALAVGLCWSVIIGVATGALIAVVYNALGFVEHPERRGDQTART